MTTFTFSIQDADVEIPVTTIANREGVNRDMVNQIDLLMAIAGQMDLDLETDEGATAAYEEEEKLATAYRLSAAMQLRPPVVPLAKAGSYRGIPVKLDQEALNEAAGLIIDKLLSRDGREDWEEYLYINNGSCHAPTMQLVPRFFDHTAESLREQWELPVDATSDIEDALKQTLLAAGMARTEDSLGLDIPFEEEPGLEAVKTMLNDIGESNIDLWRLIEAYLEGGFGISLPWRRVRDSYEHIQAPAWPLFDVVRAVMHDGQFAVAVIDKEKFIRPGDDFEMMLNTATEVSDPAGNWKYYVLSGKVIKLPFEFPDIESIDEAINASWQTAERRSSEKFVLERDLAAKLSEQYGKTVTGKDIQDALADATSFVYRAWMRNRLSTYRNDFWMPDANGKHGYGNHGYECKVRAEAFSGKQHATRMGDSSSSNIPVYVMELLANNHNAVLMMTVFGPRESVTAAFARLFSGSSRKKYATAFSAGGYSNLYPLDRAQYDHTRQRVPDTRNTWAMTLLAHQAIPDKFEVEAGYFYLLAPDCEQKAVPTPASTPAQASAPAHFLGMLDRAIMLPLLPSWAGYMWWEGIDRGLITPVEKQIGTTAGWTVGTETQLTRHHNRTWQSIIQDGLRTGIISIQDEEDIKIEAPAQDNVQTEIVPATYIEAMLDMVREAAGVPVAGD